jgi:hypothetical protein
MTGLVSLDDVRSLTLASDELSRLDAPPPGPLVFTASEAATACGISSACAFALKEPHAQLFRLEPPLDDSCVHRASAASALSAAIVNGDSVVFSRARGLELLSMREGMLYDLTSEIAGAAKLQSDPLDASRFFFWSPDTRDLAIAALPPGDFAVTAKSVQSGVTRFDASAKWLVFETGGFCYCFSRQDAAILANWKRAVEAASEFFVDDEVFYVFRSSTQTVELFDDETGATKRTEQGIAHVFKSGKVALLASRGEILVGARRFPVSGPVVAVAASDEWLCVWPSLRAAPKVERMGILEGADIEAWMGASAKVAERGAAFFEAAAAKCKDRASRFVKDIEAVGRGVHETLDAMSTEIERMHRSGNEVLEAVARDAPPRRPRAV